VQNKLQLRWQACQRWFNRSGVTVGKATQNWLMIVSLISEDGSMDGMICGITPVKSEKVLARVPGVGEVEMFGTQYACVLV
jgi:HAE1 family hydrophobic/amphiphilic exporter-1